MNLNDLSLFEEKENEEKTQDEEEVTVETPKEKWLRMLNEIKHLSTQTKINIINYLEQTDFFEAPASTKYHNNIKGGLCLHSINVAETLKRLSENNDLKWEYEDSPILIGLLHDICKIFCYDVTEKNVLLGTDPKTKKNIWGKQNVYTFNDKNILFGNHGDRSVNYLLTLRAMPTDFTIKEIACIRWHMGATQEGEQIIFNNVCRQEPLVYWTHIADNLASLSEPIEK